MLENGNFKQTIFKVQLGHENTPQAVERKAILRLHRYHYAVLDAQSRTSTSFAQRLLKHSKMEMDTKHSNYVELQFIVATSNFCDRPFSIAEYVLNY